MAAVTKPQAQVNTPTVALLVGVPRCWDSLGNPNQYYSTIRLLHIYEDQLQIPFTALSLDQGFHPGLLVLLWDIGLIAGCVWNTPYIIV